MGLFLFSTYFSQEDYQNFANASLWPFDRILQPIHYWLAQFSPNFYFPNWYYQPPGPWFQATQW